MNAADDSSVDAGHPQLTPLRRYRADIPTDTRRFFDAAPVLAVHEGPWTYSRRPGLGAALKIGGWIAAALVVLAVVLDQLREDAFLDDGNKIVAGFIVALLAFMALAGPGAFLSHGKFHHVPSGRRLRESTETYRGTEAGAAAVHAALGESGEHPVTWRDIVQLTRGPSTGGVAGRVVVTAYEAARADYAVATVHLRTADDDQFVIWPPVSIGRAVIPGLVQPSQDTTAWMGSS